MAEVLQYNDIIQQYHQNIVLYKGDVVYVASVSEDAPHKVVCYKILTGQRFSVAFNTDDFKPPNSRLGFVNTCGSVVYTTRKPVRRMNVGLNRNNLQVECLSITYPEGTGETSKSVTNLKSPDLARTMKGEYPSFEDCLDYIKAFKGAMAFDRQFAIDDRRQIWYKNKLVGDLPKNCTKVERIVFHKDYESLGLLIGDTCAKTLQAVGN